MASSTSPTHIAPLDGLRGIAVLLVLWAHFPRELTGPLGKLAYVIQPGYLGVDVFFVLSGFLITRILLHDKESGRSIYRFVARRALRIFPIYYLTILVLAVTWNGNYLLWCSVYLSNYRFAVDLSPNPMRHTWSLAVEEHFYLIWPLVVYYSRRDFAQSVITTAVIPTSLAVAIALTVADLISPSSFSAAELIYRDTICRSLSLGIGGIFAFQEHQLTRHRSTLTAASLTALAVVLIPVGQFAVPGWNAVCRLIGFGSLSGAIVLTALSTTPSNGLLYKGLTSEPLVFLGKISYGIYLYHFPLFMAFGLRNYTPDNPPNLTKGLAVVTATIILAILSHTLIERHFAKLKSYL